MNEPTMETLARRLDGVERENRRLKLVEITTLGVITALLVIVQALIATQAMAEPVLTAVCDEPSGPRIDYYASRDKSLPPKLERSEDRITGVNPTFIIDSDQPKVVTYVIGHTKKFGDPPPFGAQRADIVIHTDEMISAVKVGRGWITVVTLLPNLGLVAFTDHYDTTFLGERFVAKTFTAKCKFAK